ncbi:hypothetical protein FA95DRAFT_1610460 [Auriscalpium vulgare]|uniref:Uncharacterized protein n=1 Tax=Auriscalpium vulgare TaxID=40419 RepID=A0ACB8RDG7_9AGAM|nr:hypothetical protein FA95DRAFT_1610460 [Auriscalpium vulgare]
MATIALDIQAIVVDWVYRLSQHEWEVDYDTLLACALVCRAWRPIAQRLLFRRIPRDPREPTDVRRPPSLLLLLHILRAHPHLAVHARSIRLTLDSEARIDPDPDSDPVDVALLKACPQVARIIITEFDDSLTPTLEARLRAIPVYPESLALSGKHEMINRVLQIWPNVRTLDIGQPFTLYNDDPPLIRIPGAVQSLSFPANSPSEWISETADDLPALRSLDLMHPLWSDGDWCRRLCASGLLKRLRTLVLIGRLPPSEILEQLEQLESLVFDELPDQGISLPRTLQHVGYHCGSQPWNAPPKEATILVAALRALDGLQLVTVTRSDLPAEIQSTLMEACREMDVEFVTFETMEHFPRPVYVDWI